MINVTNPFGETAPVPESRLLEIYHRALSMHQSGGQPWIDQVMQEVKDMPEFTSYKVVLYVTRLENLAAGPITTSMGARWTSETDGLSVVQMDDVDNMSKLIITLLWIKL